MIFPYVKDLKVFVCPSNTTAPLSNGGIMSYCDPNLPQIPASYAMNADLGFQNQGQPNYSPYHGIAGIDTPSNKIMISESQLSDAHTHWPDWWACGGGGNTPCTGATGASAPIYKAMFAGHTGHINIVYCDGHAKSMLPVNLVTPISQFGQVDPVGTYTSSDPNCNINPTEPALGGRAINCDEPNPSAVAAMNAVSQLYK